MEVQQPYSHEAFIKMGISVEEPKKLKLIFKELCVDSSSHKG